MTEARDHLCRAIVPRSRRTLRHSIAGHLEPNGAELLVGPSMDARRRGRPVRHHRPARPLTADRPVTDAELAARPSIGARCGRASALAAREHDAVEARPGRARLGRRRRTRVGAATPAALDAVGRDAARSGPARDPASGLEALRSRGRYGTDAGKAGARGDAAGRARSTRPPSLQALVGAACDNVDLVDPEQARAVADPLAGSIIASGLFGRMRARRCASGRSTSAPSPRCDGIESTIWGYADAVFQTETGEYAVVDFKTDSSATTAGRAARALHGPSSPAYADA